MTFLRNLCLLLLAAAIGTTGYYMISHERIIGDRDAYLVPSTEGVKVIPLISAGLKAENGYRMAGVPDGLGAIDNGDNTLTLLMNHEISEKSGKIHDHGNTGAFISRWIITIPGHPDGAWKVLEGQDAIRRIYTWDRSLKTYSKASGEQLARLCSADLASHFAFNYDVKNIGTEERIFLGGEENDAFFTDRYGRAFAMIATGRNRGMMYELPLLGDMSFENVVASPYAQELTVVAALDDSAGKTQDTLGEVYFYVGKKTSAGNEIEQAGLTNGELYGLVIEGQKIEDLKKGLSGEMTKRFKLVPLGDLSSDNGSKLFIITKPHNPLGVTKFMRPEDGAWHPDRPGVFYFTTTGAKFITQQNSLRTFEGPGRLWEMIFDDIRDPFKGGYISVRVDGSEGVVGPDNIAVTADGKVMIQEDPGDSDHLAKIWQYNTLSLELKEIVRANPKYFEKPSKTVITTNEESSGIIDISEIAGKGWYLATVQSHAGFRGWKNILNRWRFGYSSDDGQEIVEDGQLLAIYIPPEL